MKNTIPSKQEIIAAQSRIKDYIVNTPVLTNEYINEMLGCEIYFKCENLQKIGAFKARGAVNATLSLTQDQLNSGICTHSSGNHAQAIAYAAKIVKTQAYIVVPSNTPEIKKNGVVELGENIIECEPNLEARKKAADKIVAEKGAYFIHPFDNAKVIEGQATALKEMLDLGLEFDSVMAPVGVGGLLSGTSLSAHYFSKNQSEVIGCEPEGAADAVLSFKSGNIEAAPFVNTIADGLLTTLSPLTLSIIRKYVADILLCNDEEIIAAMKLIWNRLKIIIEPSCAVPLACLIKNKERFKGKKVAIILTGGNVDINRFLG